MKRAVILILSVLSVVAALVILACPEEEKKGNKEDKKDLVLWYKMDETGGDDVNDSSGNAYHAKVIGGALFNSDGSGINLDNGSGKYIKLPRNILEKVPGDFTVSVKVFFRSGNTWCRIFDFGPPSTSNVMFLTANDLHFNMDNATPMIAPSDKSNMNNTDVWRAVSITRSNNTTTMYVNGVQIATSKVQKSNANRMPSTGEFYIGRSNWPDPYPNMMLSDFRIYNRALTGGELMEMYGNLNEIPLNAAYFDGDRLPDKAYGYNVTWTVDDGISLKNNNVIVGGASIKTVTVTAVFGPYTKVYTIRIFAIGTNPGILNISKGNPVNGPPPNFIGDPAVAVVGDTLYLIGGFDKGNTGYIIPEWVCYSTKDMVNWTYHGTVLKISDVSWGSANEAWASQMVPYKGKYYLYFCSSGTKNLGVAVANSPTGPYIDKGEPLLRSTVTTPSPNNWSDIDPTVLIDTVNGVEKRYIGWGNTNYYIAELNEDMISIMDRNGDGIINMSDIDTIVATTTPVKNFNNSPGTANETSRFTEAPWLYKRKGIYYTFYAGGWMEDLAYARAENVYGPWYFASQITEPNTTSNTSHPAVIDFRGKTYLFTHDGSLPGGSGFSRSTVVYEMKFDDLGFVYPMYESSIGVSGSASTIKTVAGAAIGYAPFNNTRTEGSPAGSAGTAHNTRDLRVGTAGDETAWEIIKSRNENRIEPEFVSIQAVRKPGLIITANSNSTAMLRHDRNANLQSAQTFRTVHGLSGATGSVSFESLVYPGYYLNNNNGTLNLSDGSDNKENCTFIVAPYETYNQYKPMPTQNSSTAPVTYPFDTFVPNGD